MQRRTGRAAALLLGASLVAAFVWSQRPHPPGAAARAADAPLRVEVEEVRARTVPIVVEALGTLRPRARVALGAQLLATVREVAPRAGDEVREGDVLVVLDDAELQARVAEGEASLASAQQVQADAQRELERTRNLFERDARTSQELDRATTEAAQAGARRAAASEVLAAARVLLGHAVLRAPFDGVVLERLANPGDLATPGRVLLTLYEPGSLRLEAELAESLVGKVAVGDELPITIDALRDAAGAPLALVGRVEELVPDVEPATRTALVKLALPALPGALPGMFGRARITVGERNAVVVPARALVARGQLEVVYAVAPDGRHAELRVVRSGARLAQDEVELLSGFDGVRQVVTTGAASLRDGMALRVDGARGGEGR
jgi:RND family efflux transporter MFP subunit